MQNSKKCTGLSLIKYVRSFSMQYFEINVKFNNILACKIEHTCGFFYSVNELRKDVFAVFAIAIEKDCIIFPNCYKTFKNLVFIYVQLTESNMIGELGTTVEIDKCLLMKSNSGEEEV